MLILSRRLGESIQVGSNIAIKILSVTGNHVRLGIDAPRSIEVHREEVYARIQAEKNKMVSKD